MTPLFLQWVPARSGIWPSVRAAGAYRPAHLDEIPDSLPPPSRMALPFRRCARSTARRGTSRSSAFSTVKSECRLAAPRSSCVHRWEETTVLREDIDRSWTGRAWRRLTCSRLDGRKRDQLAYLHGISRFVVTTAGTTHLNHLKQPTFSTPPYFCFIYRCWCGGCELLAEGPDKYNRHGTGSCDTYPCSGDAHRQCGGFDAFSLYYRGTCGGFV